MAVELRKGQKVSLEKHGVSIGEILINLNWSQPARRGLFSRAPQPIDLDLGCLFELTNGSKGAVQALGNSFGSLSQAPFISLDGDDRSGESAGGENLRINGNMIPYIKRVLIYTFIYDGIANWREANGVVTVKYPGSQDIIVRMDEYGTTQKMCAIALLENVRNETFSVEKVVRFFDGHPQMDRAFNWGLRWVPGKKD
jgi:tellurite resistance protein TerA